jgi:hypothetical protein
VAGTGYATGDSGWTHWLIWAFGGSIVDKNNKVVINSPQGVALSTSLWAVDSVQSRLSFNADTRLPLLDAMVPVSLRAAPSTGATMPSTAATTSSGSSLAAELPLLELPPPSPSSSSSSSSSL